MQSSPKFKNRLAELGLFYSAAIWGSTFFIVKDALDFMDPVIFVACRFLISALLMAIVCLILKRNLWQNLKQGIWLGVLIWMLYIPQTIGLGITTASNSGFITGLFVAFVPIFALLLFRRTPTIIDLLATGISLSGLWILTGGLGDINLGDMLTLIAAVTYAVHILFADKYVKAGADVISLSFQQFLTVGLLSLITGLAFNRPFTVTSSAVFPTILFLAVFPTTSAFLIQVFAQKIVRPVRVSLIFAFEPVFAGIFAWTLGGEQVVTHRALGGLLIFVAMLVSGIPVNWLKRKKAQ